MKLEEMLDGLIGSRLAEMSDEGFTVRGDDGKERHFVFEKDYGDCCGFNEVTSTIFSIQMTRRTFLLSPILIGLKMSCPPMTGTVSGSLSSASPRNWRSLTPTLLLALGGNMERLSL